MDDESAGGAIPLPRPRQRWCNQSSPKAIGPRSLFKGTPSAPGSCGAWRRKRSTSAAAAAPTPKLPRTRNGLKWTKMIERKPSRTRPAYQPLAKKSGSTGSQKT
eukprot:1765361-Prymnesium_polylepis.2